MFWATMEYCAAVGRTTEWAYSILLLTLGGMLVVGILLCMVACVVQCFRIRRRATELVMLFSVFAGILYLLISISGGIPYALFEARLVSVEDYLDKARAVILNCSEGSEQRQPDPSEVHWVRFGDSWDQWKVSLEAPWRQKVISAAAGNIGAENWGKNGTWTNYCLIQMQYKGSNRSSSSPCHSFRLWATCVSRSRNRVARCSEEDLKYCGLDLQAYEVTARTYNNRESTFNQEPGPWMRVARLIQPVSQRWLSTNSSANSTSYPILPLEYNSVGPDRFYMEKDSIQDSIFLDLLCCYILFGVPHFFLAVMLLVAIQN